MSEYETLDAIGGMLDREDGEPTVWTCRYCLRYAATEAEIEHRKRCPVGRLVVANKRIAALEAAMVHEVRKRSRDAWKAEQP